jgi:hypothetical protein
MIRTHKLNVPARAVKHAGTSLAGYRDAW